MLKPTRASVDMQLITDVYAFAAYIVSVHDL